jgi:hypothetical protein
VLGGSGVTEAQRYVVTNTNVGPQIGKLKSAGCEVVQLATVPGFTALALATAAKIDFKPQWVSTKGDLTGGGIVPMRFSTDDHTGYGGARMGKISNGTQQYFGPTYTTDDSDSEPEVYDGPANTPPAGAIPES